MITLKEIMLSINTQLEQIAPDVPIQSTDIEKGFETPSFFVDFESPTLSQYGGYGQERTIPIVIYYFPFDSHHKQMDILHMQGKLEQGFIKPFETHKGFTVFPMEISWTTTDGVLQFSFSLYTLEYEVVEDGEDMGDLYINVGKRE